MSAAAASTKEDDEGPPPALDDSAGRVYNDLHLPSVKLSNGAEMPLFGLGTWQSGKNEVQMAVTAAFEAGYKAIDCAAGYGNEGEVGAALADCIQRCVIQRSEVFITSKLWAASAWPDVVMAAVDKTLKDLGTPYVDLYLVCVEGWPCPRYGGRSGALTPSLHPPLPLLPTCAQALAVRDRQGRDLPGARGTAQGLRPGALSRRVARARDGR